MNKRGQMYLFTAIIVCMLAFLLVSKPNIIREQVLLQNFKDISNNYLTESPKIVNDVLRSGIPSEDTACVTDPLLCKIKNELSSFTGSFVDNYARNQDPHIGLIYIYNDKNGIVIQNNLNGENVKFEGLKESSIILSYNEQTQGLVDFGIGLDLDVGSNLCQSDQSYCIIERAQIPSGEYTLYIGDINYDFELNPESPELIVIIKSQDENTVKVDISESTL